MLSKNTSYKRKLIFFFLLMILFILVFMNFYALTHESMAVSPDKQYKAFYNLFTKTITIQTHKDNLKGYLLCPQKPGLLWSPNSKFLAINYYGDFGCRPEILNIEHSSCSSIPSKETIQEKCPEAVTKKQSDQGVCIEITEWLDNDNFVAKFTWPADELGYHISGWFVCGLLPRTIKEVVAIKEKTN